MGDLYNYLIFRLWPNSTLEMDRSLPLQDALKPQPHWSI